VGELRLVDKWRRLGGTSIVNTIPGDCTAGFQAAINACNPGDTLYVPAGTYTVSAPAPGTPAILALPFGIKIEGDGVGETIIKVANASPTYEYILGPDPWTLPMTGLEVHDITFDHNIANNPIGPELAGGLVYEGVWAIGTTYHVDDVVLQPDNGFFYKCILQHSGEEPPSGLYWVAIASENNAYPEFTIGVFATSYDVNIHDLEIINASSKNNIVLHTGTGHQIKNITASVIGDDPNHIAHDCSFIYEDTQGCTIDNVNVSAVIGGPATTCGLEIHGENYTVQNCTVNDFEIGMNLAGVAPWACSGLVTHNTVTGCSTGLFLWSYTYPGIHDAGYGIDGLTISDNDINLCYTNLPVDSPVGIGFHHSWAHSSEVPMDVNDLHITGNRITAPLEAVPGDYVSFEGCGIGRVNLNEDFPQTTLSNSTISGNVITNIPLCGIRFLCDLDNVSITGNTLIDCGSTLTGTSWYNRTPIFLDEADRDSVVISGNIFIDDLPVTGIRYWMFLAAKTTSTDLTVSGNYYNMTGDKVVFIKQIYIYDDKTRPVIAETILDFVPPTHKVISPGTWIHDGITEWTVDVDELTWTQT